MVRPASPTASDGPRRSFPQLSGARRTTNRITRIGIDLGKNTFRGCALDRAGRVVLEKRFTRHWLEKYLRAQPPCVVGMEACGGAHHWVTEPRRVLRRPSCSSHAVKARCSPWRMHAGKMAGPSGSGRDRTETWSILRTLTWLAPPG